MNQELMPREGIQDVTPLGSHTITSAIPTQSRWDTQPTPQSAIQTAERNPDRELSYTVTHSVVNRSAYRADTPAQGVITTVLVKGVTLLLGGSFLLLFIKFWLTGSL